MRGVLPQTNGEPRHQRAERRTRRLSGRCGAHRGKAADPAQGALVPNPQPRDRERDSDASELRNYVTFSGLW